MMIKNLNMLRAQIDEHFRGSITPTLDILSRHELVHVNELTDEGMKQLYVTLQDALQSTVVIRIDGKWINRGRLRSLSDARNNKFDMSIQDFDSDNVIAFSIEVPPENSKPQNNMLDNSLLVAGGNVTISWRTASGRNIVDVSTYNITRVILAKNDETFEGSFYNMITSMDRLLSDDVLEEMFDYVE